MSSQSSVFRRSASERNAEGSITGSAQESDSRSPSVEEIVEAVEIPLQSEPRNQRRTTLEDSGIRARKCTLTVEEFCKAKRLASVPGEIMLSSAERMKLMFPDAPSGNSQAPTLGGRPPTPPVKPTPETAQKKKRKETASAANALQGSESPMMKDFGHRKYVKAAFPARAMMRMAYVEIADLNEALKAAKEQAR
ncbi:unnamed protein product [Cuscuta campestris]|uniref:Uncharacterized protein n=1 Tax=Cuscuta campestris TaxID=132261 RepID=A0A484KVI6_9ASTE|nr:unnamed protein product [Cuscuta campestris]